MGKRKKAKRRGLSAAWVLPVCAVLAVLLYAAGGVREYRGASGAEAEIAESREALESLEGREPVDLNAERKRLRSEKLAANNGILVDDLEAEQQKILAMADDAEFDWASIRRWFDGTAIVGDSIIRQMRLFEMLDAPVFAQGGIHVSVELPLLDEVEAAKPSVIFLCFGMNDVGVFQERVDQYVRRYSNIIRRLQNSLPGALIYVHAALPVTPERLALESKYQYLDLYNEEMKKACPELGAYFIDSSFILKAHPEFYTEGGTHPNKIYYPLWLTYLADITGLSDE